MSFAQFNGVSSTENLFVNSITFPDGSSIQSTVVNVIDGIPSILPDEIASNAPVTLFSWYALPVGTYIVSAPYRCYLDASSTASFFTKVSLYNASTGLNYTGIEYANNLSVLTTPTGATGVREFISNTTFILVSNGTSYTLNFQANTKTVNPTTGVITDGGTYRVNSYGTPTAIRVA